MITKEQYIEAKKIITQYHKEQPVKITDCRSGNYHHELTFSLDSPIKINLMVTKILKEYWKKFWRNPEKYIEKYDNSET